MPMLTLQFTIV